MVEESSEVCTGREDEVIKARTVACTGDEHRRRRKRIVEIMGVPCEHLRGRGVNELMSRVHIAGVGAGEGIL